MPAAQVRKNLARVVKTAQRIVRHPDLDSVYAEHLQNKARSIAADPTLPGHGLFDPLTSGRRYKTIKQTEKQLLSKSCDLCTHTFKLMM